MNIGDVAVPDLICVLGQLQSLQFLGAIGREETDFHLGGVGRKESEIGSFAVPDRPVGVGAALPYSSHCESSTSLERVQAKPTRGRDHGSSGGGHAPQMRRADRLTRPTLTYVLVSVCELTVQ